MKHERMTGTGVISRYSVVLLLVAAAILVLAQESGTSRALPQPQADRGIDRYKVDTKQSGFRILGYRGGLLSRFGHNHVISGRFSEGLVSISRDWTQNGLELELKVQDLIVDDPDLRAEEGHDFSSDVSEEVRSATRAYMLGNKLLHASQSPRVRITATKAAGNLPDFEIAATVFVHDSENLVTIPARVDIAGDKLLAHGEFQISHADIGLKPFKALLGTLRVREEMTIKYQIVADKVAE